VKQQASTVQA
jgi:hypothetical protein